MAGRTQLMMNGTLGEAPKEDGRLWESDSVHPTSWCPVSYEEAVEVPGMSEPQNG